MFVCVCTLYTAYGSMCVCVCMKHNKHVTKLNKHLTKLHSVQFCFLEGKFFYLHVTITFY